MEKKAISETGTYLNAAAPALEKAWAWSGREIESGADAAIRYAREVGDRLEKEEDQVSAEVVEAVDKLGKGDSRIRTQKSQTIQEQFENRIPSALGRSWASRGAVDCHQQGCGGDHPFRGANTDRRRDGSPEPFSSF